MTRYVPLLAVLVSATLLSPICGPTAGETVAGPGAWTQTRLIKSIATENGVLATVYTKNRKWEVRVIDSTPIMIQGRKAFFRDFAPGSEIWIQALANRPDFAVRVGDAYSFVVHLRRRGFDAKMVEVTPTTCILETANGARMTRTLSPKCTFWGPEGEFKAAADLTGRTVRVLFGEGVETVEAIADREGLGFYILHVVQASEEKAK